jgi:hypothetical protein
MKSSHSHAAQSAAPTMIETLEPRQLCSVSPTSAALQSFSYQAPAVVVSAGPVAHPTTTTGIIAILIGL